MELTAMKQHLDRLYEIFNAGDWSREDRAAYEAVTAFVRASEPKDDAAERALCKRAAEDIVGWPEPEAAEEVHVLRAQARAESLWEGYSIGLRARIDTAQREIQRLKDCYAEESSRLLDTRTKLSAAQAEIANQRIELSETVHMSTHDALQTKLSAAQAEIERLRADKRFGLEVSDMHCKSACDLETKLSAAQAEIERLKQERDVMAFERDTHMELSQNTAATFHTNGVQSLNKQVSDLTAQLSAAQALNDQCARDLAAIKASR